METTTSRVRGILNIPCALGFGCFLAWQFGLVAFLFPASHGLVVSPLVFQAFSCCLISFVALLAFRSNRGSFSQWHLDVVAFCAVLLGTVAGILSFGAHEATGPVYVASVVVGFSTAVLFYVWADILSRLDGRRRLGTSIVGLGLASVLEIVVGSVDASAAVSVLTALLGVGTFIGFLANSLGVDAQATPLVVRPAKSHHYKSVLLAIILFALVFGSVSGITACISEVETVRTFHVQTAWWSLALSAILLVLIAVFPRPVILPSIGRVLAPALAILFLLQIILHDNLGGLLPSITLGMWQFMQVFVVLLLIDLAEAGLASLSVSFPLGWAVIALGFSIGSAFGQYSAAVFGSEESVVSSISALHTITVVVAAVILTGAKYPRPAVSESIAHDQPGHMPEPQQVPPVADELPEAADVHAPDPIAVACDHYAELYRLSGREKEVLELLARGNTRASIADHLFISENTVRVHVKNIYAKFQIHSKQELIDLVDEFGKSTKQ